ncbi:putative monooxygenase [Leptodontidium sp. 2 PMI_412]|nr:putative monooxygenase [Leptodontidium sp. 2 PMI_412]
MGEMKETGLEVVYEIPDVSFGSARQLRVICIGAGASGINLAYQFGRHMKNVDLQIYEKNEGVGGTWLENKYPGCACDIPAHNYQFSWAPNPRWTQFYASAPEILKYLQDTTRKFDLEKHMNFRHKVTQAKWDEVSGLWNLAILDESTGRVIEDSCHILINGSGFLNHWRWPEIPGLHSFEGDLMHTASWKDGTNFKDKRVGVIGNGSSGIQVLVSLYPEVKTMTTFIRSSTWVTTSFAQQFAGPDGANFDYTEEQKAEFAGNPQKMLAYQKDLELAMSARFELNLKDSPLQEQAKQYLTAQMKAKLGQDHPLTKVIIPDFGVGCKRPTPGLGYLEALSKPNTRVIMEPIAEVLPNAVKLKSGEIVALDSLICATGFDYSWIPRFPIIGRGGVDIRELWKERPYGYMGLAVHHLPNYFVFLGPNSPLSHGSTLPTLEIVTKYICRVVWKLQTENYKSMVPTNAAVADFLAHCDKFHQRTIWGTKCRSWFKGGKEDGHVLTHPGSRFHNVHMLINPRYEDWEWTSLSTNRFAYLGNGLTVLEKEEKEEKRRDPTWFLDDPDKGYEGLIY